MIPHLSPIRRMACSYSVSEQLLCRATHRRPYWVEWHQSVVILDFMAASNAVKFLTVRCRCVRQNHTCANKPQSWLAEANEEVMCLLKKQIEQPKILRLAEKSKIPRMFAHYLLTEGTGEAQIRPSVGDLCSILSVRIEAVPFRDIVAQSFHSPEHRLSANCLAQAPRTQPGGHFRLPITGRQCEDRLE